MTRNCVYLIGLLALLARGGAAEAFEVDYIGSIEQGLAAPTSLVAGADHLAVLEPFAHRVLIYTPDGRVSRKVDLAGDGIGLARLNASTYLLCDRESRQVITLDMNSGQQSTFARAPAVSEPIDILIGTSEVFILDAGSREILRLSPAGEVQERVALHTEDDAVSYPTSFDMDAARQTFFVFDQTSSQVFNFSRSGAYLARFGEFGGGDGNVTRGGEIACDGRGFVYVADRFQGRIAVFSESGEFQMNIAPPRDTIGSLSIPTGLTVDPEGFLYVSSTEGPRIDIFHPRGSQAPNLAMAAIPAYPINRESVSPVNLTFIANIALDTVTGIDFRVVLGDDPSQVVDEGANVSPIEATEDQGGVVIAEWRPESSLNPDQTYAWQVRARQDEFSGPWTDLSWFVTSSPIATYHLEQNFPNPFQSGTTIAFEVPTESEVLLSIYDISGRKVWNQTLGFVPTGRHQIEWSGMDAGGRPVGAGVYFYRLNAGSFQQTKKMIVMRRGL